MKETGLYVFCTASNRLVASLITMHGIPKHILLNWSLVHFIWWARCQIKLTNSKQIHRDLLCNVTATAPRASTCFSGGSTSLVISYRTAHTLRGLWKEPQMCLPCLQLFQPIFALVIFPFFMETVHYKVLLLLHHLANLMVSAVMT